MTNSPSPITFFFFVLAIFKHPVYQESYGIVRLYNFTVSNYVETVKSELNSQMSNY
jgi:hypothetical protein